MKTNFKTISASILLAATLAVPSAAFADTSMSPAPVASKSPKAVKTADPAKAAYKAALAQFKTDMAAYRSAVAARVAARKSADATFKTDMAAAKTAADKQAAKSKHVAAIASLPALPTKPVAPTPPAK